MTIVMAIGLAPSGELISLYTGEAYSSATAALYCAGDEGRIIEGWVFNNPVSVLHQYYDRKPVHAALEQDDARRKSKQARVGV